MNRLSKIERFWQMAKQDSATSVHIVITSGELVSGRDFGKTEIIGALADFKKAFRERYNKSADKVLPIFRNVDSLSRHMLWRMKEAVQFQELEPFDDEAHANQGAEDPSELKEAYSELTQTRAYSEDVADFGPCSKKQIYDKVITGLVEDFKFSILTRTYLQTNEQVKYDLIGSVSVAERDLKSNITPTKRLGKVLVDRILVILAAEDYKLLHQKTCTHEKLVQHITLVSRSNSSMEIEKLIAKYASL